MQIDKDLFNPLSLFHCRTHARDGDERETRREKTGWRLEGEERRGEERGW